MQVPVSRSQDDLGAGAKKVAPASQIPASIFVFVFLFPFFSLFLAGALTSTRTDPWYVLFNNNNIVFATRPGLTWFTPAGHAVD